MKKEGSIIADEIMHDWIFEKELKRLYESRLREEQRKKEEQNSIK